MDIARPASLDAPLAILGGTFDPVHYGHLRLAQDVRQALDLDRVLLVPAADPPHRDAPQAPIRDRIAMLDLAVVDFPGIVVDTREVRRAGKSYTVDTLAELRAEGPRTPLLLVVGADAFRGLPSWHRWLALFDLAHLVVIPRPGVALDAGTSRELQAQWRSRRIDDARGLRSRIAGAIYVQPVAPQAVSSTAIRAAFARADAKPVEFAGLLPPAVFAYIESHGLYRHPPHAR